VGNSARAGPGAAWIGAEQAHLNFFSDTMPIQPFFGEKAHLPMETQKFNQLSFQIVQEPLKFYSF
jgi:hypothetical protein